jgi:multisubunit Na+/H+ antiporter MnhE subunit
MRVAAFAAPAVFYAVAWWALAEGREGSWTVGVPVVLLAAAVRSRVAPGRRGGVSPLRWLGFGAWFVGSSLRAGWSVAGLAFRGPGSLAPALREVQLERLRGGWAALVGYTATLVPGTCTVDLDERGLVTLHALVDGPEAEAEIRELERRIGRLGPSAGDPR